MRPILIIYIIFCFLITSIIGPCYAYAQDFILPAPGKMLALSPAYSPVVLKGIKLDPNDPFRFHFYIDTGNGSTQGRPLREESSKLIKYFLASLTIPEKDLWVNLSPYEKNRIVPSEFGQTEMGRDLLGQDYILKQITASLIYPESKLGREFWQKVYAQAQAKYGRTDIPINTFNKVWILPDKAVVYENGGTAFVLENHLKVMLEQDYLSLQKHMKLQRNEMASVGVNIIREIVIPALTKEVNEGKNFAPLRQVFYSLILATWYKKKIKESILNKVFSDQGKISGVQYDKSVILSETKDHKSSLNYSLSAQNDDAELIYQQYLKAFKKGVYNYIAEEPDLITGQTIPRKYFSGGVTAFCSPVMTIVNLVQASKVKLAAIIKSKIFDFDIGFKFMRGDGISYMAGFADRATTSIIADVKVPKGILDDLDKIMFSAGEHVPISWAKFHSKSEFEQIWQQQKLEDFDPSLGHLTKENDNKNTSEFLTMIVCSLLKEGKVGLLQETIARYVRQFSWNNIYDRYSIRFPYVLALCLEALSYSDPASAFRILQEEAKRSDNLNTIISLGEILDLLNLIKYLGTVTFTDDELNQFIKERLSQVSINDPWVALKDTDNDRLLAMAIWQLSKRKGIDTEFITLRDLRNNLYIHVSDLKLYFHKGYDLVNSREKGYFADLNNPIREALGDHVGRWIGGNIVRAIITPKDIYSQFFLSINPNEVPQKNMRDAQSAQLVYDVFVRKVDDSRRMIQRSPVGGAFVSFDQDQAFNSKFIELGEFLGNMSRDFKRGQLSDDYNLLKVWEIIQNVKKLDIHAKIQAFRHEYRDAFTGQEVLEFDKQLSEYEVFLLETQRHIEEDVKIVFKELTGEELPENPAMNTVADAQNVSQRVQEMSLEDYNKLQDASEYYLNQNFLYSNFRPSGIKIDDVYDQVLELEKEQLASLKKEMGIMDGYFHQNRAAYAIRAARIIRKRFRGEFAQRLHDRELPGSGIRQAVEDVSSRLYRLAINDHNLKLRKGKIVKIRYLPEGKDEASSPEEITGVLDYNLDESNSKLILFIDGKKLQEFSPIPNNDERDSYPQIQDVVKVISKTSPAMNSLLLQPINSYINVISSDLEKALIAKGDVGKQLFEALSVSKDEDVRNGIIDDIYKRFGINVIYFKSQRLFAILKPISEDLQIALTGHHQLLEDSDDFEMLKDSVNFYALGFLKEQDLHLLAYQMAEKYKLSIQYDASRHSFYIVPNFEVSLAHGQGQVSFYEAQRAAFFLSYLYSPPKLSYYFSYIQDFVGNVINKVLGNKEHKTGFNLLGEIDDRENHLPILEKILGDLYPEHNPKFAFKELFSEIISMKDRYGPVHLKTLNKYGRKNRVIFETILKGLYPAYDPRNQEFLLLPHVRKFILASMLKDHVDVFNFNLDQIVDWGYWKASLEPTIPKEVSIASYENEFTTRGPELGMPGFGLVNARNLLFGFVTDSEQNAKINQLINSLLNNAYSRILHKNIYSRVVNDKYDKLFLRIDIYNPQVSDQDWLAIRNKKSIVPSMKIPVRVEHKRYKSGEMISSVWIRVDQGMIGNVKDQAMTAFKN